MWYAARMTRPSFKGLSSSSPKASRAARGSSRKEGNTPERILRKALWSVGLRYRKNVQDLPGKPDIVFRGPRVVIFCDGDFWHGCDWQRRRQKLARGSNSSYWLSKIERNMERDAANDLELIRLGWRVLRVWEGDIHGSLDEVVTQVQLVLGERARGRS